jgi:hypothetical protein
MNGKIVNMQDCEIEKSRNDDKEYRNSTFRKELKNLINCYSRENGSDTPDWILADYLFGCLENFDKTLQAREKWYGRDVRQKSYGVVPTPENWDYPPKEGIPMYNVPQYSCDVAENVTDEDLQKALVKSSEAHQKQMEKAFPSETNGFK